jgi:hypothetical protein
MCRENKVTDNCCGCGCCDMVEEGKVEKLDFESIKAGLPRSQAIILEALNFLGGEKEADITRIAAYQKENHMLREELAVVKGNLRSMTELYCLFKEVALFNQMIDDFTAEGNSADATILAIEGVKKVAALIYMEQEMVKAGLLTEVNK